MTPVMHRCWPITETMALRCKARGWFKSALADAGVEDYTWRCNRHTFASRIVMAGVDIRTVGELLGHRFVSYDHALLFSHEPTTQQR